MNTYLIDGLTAVGLAVPALLLGRGLDGATLARLTRRGGNR